MQRKLLKRKSWSDDGGVSEIIGNILILMMTVVLFSGIMVFVNQIPMPEMTVKADFTAGVTFDNSGTEATVTVTHIGGATMKAVDTAILVSVDDYTYSYMLSEDPDFPYDEWAAGLAWVSGPYPSFYYSSISVTIVDEVTHNAVWISQVSGGMGQAPPSILQRYVDSNEDTPTVDPIKQDDNFTLYVRVSDINNDLASVWIETDLLSNDPVPSDNYGWTGVPRNGGWFEWAFIEVADDVRAVDGKVIVICAKDDEGLTTVVPYKLSVIVLPSDIYNIEAYDEPQEGGMPSYITKISYGQGWEFFGENTSSFTADLSDARTTFDRGETVYVRAASMYVDNLLGANELTFTYSATGIALDYLVTYKAPSTIADPFYRYAYGGNVAVYQCVFNTTHMMPGTYDVSAILMCTGVVDYTFVFTETLYILDADSPMAYYPRVWVSNDEDFTETWGYSKTTAFNATGANYLVWVAIAVQDAQVTPPSPSLGEIRIMDLTGGTELYGPPDSGDMIGAVERSETNATAYYFWIDLRLNNGDTWKLGTNSYTLQISQFSDDNEGVYTYSLPIFVRTSSSRSDFFVGTNGIYNSLGSSTNFISPDYAYYIENNNFFTMRTLYSKENAPSTAPLYYENAMAVGDLDNDGDMDLLVGSNMDNSGSYPNSGEIVYFENTMNTFGVWQSASYITRPVGDTTTTKIKWIDTGDINGDGFTDFAYVTTENKVWVFNNTYAATGKQFPVTISATNDGVRKVALEDMNADGCDDLILLNMGRIQVYDLQEWDTTPLAKIPVIDTYASNIEDFDVADVNGDGMLDILTADPTLASHDGIEGVWVNNYTTTDDPDAKFIDEAVASICIAGSVISGDVLATQDMEDDDLSLVLSENETGDPTPLGQVSFVFPIDAPLTDDTDQQLVVRAMVADDSPADEPQEVFYVWYSTDQNASTAKFTPVLVISADTFTNYTFNLPASAAGSDYLWVKFTDSSLSPGMYTEELHIDYVGVQYDRFGTYWPAVAEIPPTRYQVRPVADVYTTVRAMDYDGVGGLETVVAKDYKFAVYSGMTAVSGWTVVDTTSSMLVSTADLSQTTGRVVLEAISPTLFEVADINGDGLDDIMTSWITQGDAYEVSLLKAYLNMGETYWAINVKDVFAGMLDTSEKGSIVYIAIADVYNRA